MDDDTLALVTRFRAGETLAADELFNRYAERLLAVARGRLSGRLGRRVDAEDVVQSVYRSFFIRAREGQYQFGGSGELWRLLVAITLNKVRGQIEHHTAGKRSIGAERSLSTDPDTPAPELDVLCREPTPEQAAALVEQVQTLMLDLDGQQRRMLELRLQGYQIEEIAADVGRSERGVRRLLDKIKDRLRSAGSEGVRSPPTQ